MEHLLCLLGAFLLAQCCLFGCSQGQCDALSYVRKDVTDVRDCNQMYTIFEDALLSNKDNLYNLQEVFFSSEHLQPSLLTVNYHIETSKNVTLLPMTWSRSNLFVYVNPVVFLVCEPVIAWLMFQIVNAQVLPQQTELSLSINITDVPKNISDGDILHTLNTLTARVSFFAQYLVD